VNRSTVAIVVLAALGVLAVGLIAGSIHSATALEDGGGSGFALGSGDGDLPLPSVSGSAGQPGGGMPWLTKAVLVLGAVVTLIGLIATISDPRRLAVILVFLGVVVLLSVLANSADFASSAASGSPIGADQEADQPGAPQSPASPLSLAWAIVPLVGIVGLAAGVVYVSNAASDRDDEAPVEGEEGTSGEDDAAAVARIAGETAERIEEERQVGGDLENEVYRAWQEMTAQLSVPNPESTTPGEFAEAATGAGLDDDAVAELTELFEAVRYGGQNATESREQHAIRVLERVEHSGQQATGET